MEGEIEVAEEAAPVNGGAAPAPEPEREAQAEPAREIDDGALEREVAALLFASPDPLSLARLADLSRVGAARAARALDDLARRLGTSGLPFELREIAGGWQLLTTAEVADAVAGLAKAPRDEKVSPATLETLSVVAYRQPVTKAEIEAIRGVQVGPILRALVDRGLVRVCGRSNDPGHALLYATTKRFLDAFGLPGLEELPRDGELLRD